MGGSPFLSLECYTQWSTVQIALNSFVKHLRCFSNLGKETHRKHFCHQQKWENRFQELKMKSPNFKAEILSVVIAE